MKTRDNRREFIAGHMERGEEMGAETPSFNCGKLICSAVLGKLRVMQQVFFPGGFSAAFLYLVVTVYWMTHLHQNFAVFCICILSTTKYFWPITVHLLWQVLVIQYIATIVSSILYLKDLTETYFHEWWPTSSNTWSLLKQHMKGMSTVWVAKQQKAIERNTWIKKRIIFFLFWNTT